MEKTLWNERTQCMPISILAVFNFQVFMSHGLSDTDIPFYAGNEIKEMLSANQQHILTFISFEGGHGVPLEIALKTVNFLNRLLASFNKQSDG
jgi:predicted esterase